MNITNKVSAMHCELSTENPEILLEIARHINTNRASIDEEVSGNQRRHQ